MSKDAYYFSHDANAHQDPKITKLFLAMNPAGYGIYWVIIEMLRSEDSLSLNKSDYDAIAYNSHSDCITVACVVENFDLFKIEEDGTFYSESLRKRTEKYRLKSIKYRENALKRWDNDAMAMQSQCNGNALKESKVKESKVKETKENNTIPKNPSLEDVINYCKERKNSVNPNKWFDHYTSNGWMVGKNKMKDWKAAVRTWEQSDNKQIIKPKKYAFGENL